MRARDVFTPGKQPIETYNNRQSQDIEKKLRSWIEFAGEMLIITGQSKVGKTVLVRNVIPDNLRIEVQSSDIPDLAHFFEVIASKIEVPQKKQQETVNSENTNLHLNVEAEAGAKVSLLEIIKTGFKFKSIGELKEEDEKKTVEIYTRRLEDAVFEHLINDELILVIDDFHYIPAALQIELVRTLKNPISQGLKTVVIMIPNRGEDVIKAEPDYVGRVKYLPIPEWNVEELAYIPENGFPKLNVECVQELMNHIAKNSFTTPFLAQKICSQICAEEEIYETKPEKILLEKAYIEKLPDIYHEVATYPELLDKIVKGKTTKGMKRVPRKLKDGSEVDIYELIIMALAEIAERNSVDIQTFVTKVQSFLEEPSSVRKSDIVGTLNRMVSIARETNAIEPVIDYQESTEEVVLNDPFFSFDLRWGRRQK